MAAGSIESPRSSPVACRPCQVAGWSDVADSLQVLSAQHARQQVGEPTDVDKAAVTRWRPCTAEAITGVGRAAPLLAAAKGAPVGETEGCCVPTDVPRLAITHRQSRTA